MLYHRLNNHEIINIINHEGCSPGSQAEMFE